MLCQNCQKEIPDDSIFCEYCGTKLEKPEEVLREETPKTVLEQPEEAPERKEKTIVEEKPALFKLIFKEGEKAGEEVTLEKDLTTIGRKKENDIVLADRKVSASHAQIKREADRYILEDLKSTNGTYVNDQRITKPYQLKEGDFIKIGDSKAEFKRVEEKETLEEVAEEQAQEEAIYCPKCKTQLPANAIFCHICGAKISEPLSPEQPRIQPLPPPATEYYEVPKIRNPWGVAGLIFITLGIYFFVWIYKIHKEVKSHLPESNISPGLALGLSFIPLFSIIWICILLGKLAESVNTMQSQDGYGKIIDPGWPVFFYIVGQVLSLIGGILFAAPLLLIACGLVQNALNKHWQWHQFGKSPLKSREGLTPTSPFGWGIILALLGFIGSISSIGSLLAGNSGMSEFVVVEFLSLLLLGGGSALMWLGWKNRY